MQIKMQVSQEDADKYIKYYVENKDFELFGKKYVICGYKIEVPYHTIYEITLNCEERSTKMKYDPVDGNEFPYPDYAEDYRAYHGNVAWLYNPYTGKHRDARDIGSDVFGHLIEG